MEEYSDIKVSTGVTEEKEKLNARLKALMEQDTVMLFMKGTPDAPRCGFSRKIVGLLKDQEVKYSSFDILSDESVRSGTEALDQAILQYLTFCSIITRSEGVQ